MPEKAPLRIAILLSGGGTTMVNLWEHIRDGKLPAQIALVLASNSRAQGIERAERRDLPTLVVRRADYQNVDDYSQIVWSAIRQARADLVCLAGFLSLIRIPEDYVGRVMNIHPALLPSFGGRGMYGHHVHEAVLGHGCKISGCTVHFADNDYDAGPIIIQRAVPVMEEDTPQTLAARVFEQECVAYPQAIRLFADKRLSIEDRRVKIAPDLQQ